MSLFRPVRTAAGAARITKRSTYETFSPTSSRHSHRLPLRRLASDTSHPLNSSGSPDPATPSSSPRPPPLSGQQRPSTAQPPPSPQSSQPPPPSPSAAFTARPYPNESSLRRPSAVPPPPPPPPKASGRGKVFWSFQAFFAIGFAGLGGYYLAAKNNAQLLSAGTGDVTLVPSAIGIKRQEAKPPSYGTTKDYESAIEALKVMIRRKGLSIEDRISTDPSDLETHGVSDWSYHEEKRPTVVVWVENTEEVQEVMLIARQYKVPITPYGGATSLEGHFSSPFGGISLDMSRMDKILRVSEADGDVTVQSGVKWEDLNAHLAEKKISLFFPLDPGPGATIGGMVGTGCSGTNAVRYGTAKGEWFLNLTVVLSSGEVIKTRQRARKSSAGWDTTKLFIGAEGTLGIVTEATLRLAPLMPTKCAVVTFKGVEEAVSAATEVVNAGFPVQCVEFLDARTMKAINNGGISGRKYPEKDCLFFKFQGSDSAMTDVSKGVQSVTRRHGGGDFIFSKTDQEAHDLWQGRKAALWSVMALKEGSKVWTTDVCVPISKLPRLIRETTEDFENRGLTACHFGHVGDGNVHSLALFSDQEELAKIRVAVHEMVERAIRLEGTCTGEHGVGVGKIEYLDEELGRGTVNLMETVKRTLDPLNLLNPGKLYPHIKPIVHGGGKEEGGPKPKEDPKTETPVSEPKEAPATKA